MRAAALRRRRAAEPGEPMRTTARLPVRTGVPIARGELS
jgi:hypothetical protein